jgi:aminopeptidase N
MCRLFLFLFVITNVQAQTFTQKDTLRGTLSKERTWFDVNYYHLNLEVDPVSKSIAGFNDIAFTVLKSSNVLQLDLFENMLIDSVIYKGLSCDVSRTFDAFFVDLPYDLNVGSYELLRVYYHGTPIEAKRAPWDGGFVWKKDESGLPWIGVACQGMGASAWWPCKDHLSDEPDSMRITCSVPKEIQFVGNGNLESEFIKEDKRVSTWKVSYPINTYNVTLNIADYSHLSDVYIINADTLALDYYVLKGNEQKAEQQFQQVKPMLSIYEELFGAYPFWNDGYALVETPYLGMEHQSAIAYGNKYKPGYLGRYPGEMDFDFIVIHESGHEYWGNSVSMNDLADMWIHESFCTYTEALYVEKLYGYESMLEYLLYQKDFIDGGSPILGRRDVNHQGNHTDMYYKGSWMLHSIRNTINNDSLWFSIIKGVAQEFAIRNCDGEEIIDYICDKSGVDLRTVFNQYLAYAEVPVLKYEFKKKRGDLLLYYKWETADSDFDMPIDLSVGNTEKFRIFPNSKYQVLDLGNTNKKSVKFSEELFLFEKIED